MSRGTRLSLFRTCLTTVLIAGAASFADRTLIDIVVTHHVQSELQPKLDRLATDLRNDGYTARITTWPAGKSGRDVWNHLKDGYDNDNLQGALLVGHVPATRAGNGKNLSDIPYWCMSSYSSMRSKDIWVSRFFGPIASDHYIQPDHDYGDEIRFLENALDANHEYRTGKTRLPHTAFTHTCIRREDQNKACKGHQAGVRWARTARDIWPESRALYAEQLPDAMFEWGGDLLDEASHGSYTRYAEGNIHQDKILEYGCRIRTILTTSCTVGGFGDVVNLQNVCDNTYNVISVGATAHDYVHWNGEWDHTILDNDGASFRRQLKSGKPWGPAMISAYPFENDEKTLMYGDLSLKPMAFPPGEPTPEYTVTVIAQPGGTITPLRPVRVLRGNDEAFTITPAELFYIQDVHVDGKSVGAVSSHTFENVQSDHTIEAIFASTSATIVSDDFESGDLNGGAGSWIKSNPKDWTSTWTSGEVVEESSPRGTFIMKTRYCFRSFAVLNWYTKPIKLTFQYRSESFTESERLLVSIYNKGWNKVAELKGTDATFQRFESDITSCLEPASDEYRIMFMRLPSKGNGVAYIDDVIIHAAGNERSSEPPGKARDPSPVNGTADIGGPVTLSWTSGGGATSHIVYLGTDATPDDDEKQGTQTTTVFDPGALKTGTTYYWRIDEVNEHGTTTGEVWSFTTGDDAVGRAAASVTATSVPRLSCAGGRIVLRSGSHEGLPASIRIVDLCGRIVLERTVERTTSVETLPFPTNAHGTYIATVRLGEVYVRKISTVVE